MAFQHPEVFARLVVISGYSNLEPSMLGRKLKPTPIAIFHGLSDTVVAPENSLRIFNAFKSAGSSRVFIHFYQNTGHNAWDLPYGNPAVVQWILGNSLSTPFLF